MTAPTLPDSAREESALAELRDVMRARGTTEAGIEAKVDGIREMVANGNAFTVAEFAEQHVLGYRQWDAQPEAVKHELIHWIWPTSEKMRQRS